MKSLFILYFFTILVITGCSSKVVKNAASREDNTAVPSLKQGEYSKTTIKANSSSVDGIIDSVLILNEKEFRIFLHIDSVFAETGIEPLATPGQKVELVPRYFASEGGKIDLNEERNKKIYLLRTAARGDRFGGKISLLPEVGWVITYVRFLEKNH